MSDDKKRSKYLLKNILIFTFGNVGTKLINFILVPLYTYVLSTEEYGIVNLIFVICAIVTPILMGNVGESIKRFLLDKKYNEDSIVLNGLIWFCIGIFLTFISTILFNLYEPVSNYIKN